MTEVRKSVWKGEHEMARVKIEGILESLDYELKKALRDTIDEYNVRPNMSDSQLYRVFVKKAYKRCSTWERVPDRCIDSN